MSLSNKNFLEEHTYIFACGFKLKLSCDIDSNDSWYKVKTRFKVEVTHIKINNVWKDYSTYINELVTLTGLPFSVIDENYKRYMFGINTFDGVDIIYKSLSGSAYSCYEMFDGNWHYVNEDQYDYKLTFFYTFDDILGTNSYNKSFENIEITIDPQYVKFPTKKSEFQPKEQWGFYSNANYTGYKPCTNTNIFGFLDLGILEYFNTGVHSNVVKYAYASFSGEYDATFVSRSFDNYETQISSLYYNVTVKSNYSSYNNKSFVICRGVSDNPGHSIAAGVEYADYNIEFYILKRVGDKTNYLKYITDLQFALDTSTLDKKTYSIRSNKKEYYITKELNIDNTNVQLHISNVETIKKGKYKINFECTLKTDKRDTSDLSDLFEFIININGETFKMPYEIKTTNVYIIVETNEQLYAINAEYYIASKYTKTPHRESYGYTYTRDIKTNNVLLPKETSSTFGFKINNKNHTIVLANTDISISNCLSTKQLAFRPNTKKPFILHFSNNKIGYHILAPANIDDLTDDDYVTMIININFQKEDKYKTAALAIEAIQDIDMSDYILSINDKNYTINRNYNFAGYMSSSSNIDYYKIECNSMLTLDIKISDIPNIINNYKGVDGKIVHV